MNIQMNLTAVQNDRKSNSEAKQKILKSVNFGVKMKWTCSSGKQHTLPNIYYF